MTAIETIKVFEEKHVRTVWDDAQEQWYVSIVDVIEILTGSDRPRKYWSDLKKKLKVARKELEAKTGKKVVTSQNAKHLLDDKQNDHPTPHP